MAVWWRSLCPAEAHASRRRLTPHRGPWCVQKVQLRGERLRSYLAEAHVCILCGSTKWLQSVMRKWRIWRALCAECELSSLCSTREGIVPVSVHLWSVKTKNERNIHRQFLNVPVFKLLNGSVYCPTNSLSDVESWSSTAKRTSARSGTYTSNWKFSFHIGLKPWTEKKKHDVSNLTYHRCYGSLISDVWCIPGVIW